MMPSNKSDIRSRKLSKLTLCRLRALTLKLLWVLPMLRYPSPEKNKNETN